VGLDYKVCRCSCPRQKKDGVSSVK
jgi:hypothetical protein